MERNISSLLNEELFVLALVGADVKCLKRMNAKEQVFVTDIIVVRLAWILHEMLRFWKMDKRNVERRARAEAVANKKRAQIGMTIMKPVEEICHPFKP